MTPDYDNMPAGREMDLAVARNIFGDFYHTVKQYTADIAAAWLVVEKLTCTTKQWFHYEQSSTTYTAIFQNDAYEGYDAQAEADTAPLAICRAALKALRAQQEPEGAGK